MNRDHDHGQGNGGQRRDGQHSFSNRGQHFEARGAGRQSGDSPRGQKNDDRGGKRNDRPFRKDGEFRRDGERPYRKDGEFRKDGERPYRKDGEFRKDSERPYRKDGEFRKDGERPYRKDGEFRRDGECPYRKDGEFRKDGDRPHHRDGEFRRDGERPYRKDGEFRKDGERPYRKESEFRKDGERPYRKESEFRRDGEHPYRRDDRRMDGLRGNRPPYGREQREDRPRPSQTARDVALKALAEVVGKGAFASQALNRALTDARLSDEDRRLAASLFYFAIENRLRIEWTLNKLMENRPEPMIADILHIAAAQILFMDRIPDHAAVDEAVKQAKSTRRDGLAGLVNGVLRSLIRMRDEGELTLPDREEQPEEYLSVKYSLAVSAVKRLIAGYGMDRAEQIAAYVPAERTQTIRPNVTRISVEAFEDMLNREGLHWRHGAVKHSYTLTEAGDLSERSGYKEGLYSIQGESSMLAAQAVGAKPGMQILDACAAPGGKTCLMAEEMGTSGRVYAWDVYPHRVELIRAAAQRLGLENVRPAVHDSKKTMEALELGMDAVLVDAPCSGLGVIADKPDIKYRVTDKDFEALLPLQRQILENCAGFVRVGGLLVYSTCTILPEENEQQVNAFLEKHPEFERVTDEQWLPESLRGKLVDGMLTILPSRDSMEGFFIARMRRRSV